MLMAAACAWIGVLLLLDATPDLVRVLLLSERFSENAEAVVERDEIEQGGGSLPGFPSPAGNYRHVEYVFRVGGQEISGDWMAIRHRRAHSDAAPRERFPRGARVTVCFSRVVPSVNALTCDSTGGQGTLGLFLYWFIAVMLLVAPVQLMIGWYRKYRKGQK